MHKIRQLIEEARLRAEEIPVNDNPTAANAYAAIHALANAVEEIAKVAYRAHDQGHPQGSGR